MKIKREHYNLIKIGMKESLNKLKSKCINDKNELIKYYTDNKIGKNYTDKACFDLLNSAKIDNTTSTRFICDTLYQYLDDRHINTALKSIIKEL